MTNIVIVESPAKAGTIKRYLGKDYEVLASYGHVRDLAPKEGSVRPYENFALTWSVMPRASKRLQEIARAIKGAERLLLATDPDREGEAIAWHILEALSEKKGILDKVEVSRISFNAITETAVKEALRKPRKIDPELVDAYRARRALDYLVGFTLSPVLWRKLPGSRSAGRVQSVALRLICDREEEREKFEEREYWTISAEIASGASSLTASLVELEGEKLSKFALKDKDAAKKARETIEPLSWALRETETKPLRRRPAPPFTTSTLTQEAVRKLGFTARETMRVAQRLYEGLGDGDGLITYMRTDAVQVAPQAIKEARASIGKTFGSDYLPDKPYFYKTRAKNAQEAHEAIRPTSIARRPSSLRGALEPKEHRLYEMIWNRMVASQMEAARLERTSASFADTDAAGHLLRATGQRILFDGFLKLYRETTDSDDDKQNPTPILPALKKGDIYKTKRVEDAQHFTQPPPRFTEASLVREMERIGIGRPSTYAPILSLLRERNYVTMEKNRFAPHSRGRLVTAFLQSFFGRYVSYDFTADLEDSLDHISAGEEKWRDVLSNFWKAFAQSVEETSGLRISEVLDKLNVLLAPLVFPKREDGKDPRACPICDEGELSIKTGRYGAFVGCSRYPDCRHTRPLTVAEGEGDAPQARALGKDEETGAEISVKSGRYGPYVERAAAKEGEKAKRVSLPQGHALEEVDLETALGLLSLPRLLGKHPDTGADVRAGVGRFGPYVLHKGVYASIGKDEDVLTVGLNRAVALLAEKARRGERGTRTRSAPSGKLLGEHPEDKEQVYLQEKGRYGPYVRMGRVNASIPQDMSPSDVDLDAALSLLEARMKRAKTPKRKVAKVKKVKKAKKTAARKKKS